MIYCSRCLYNEHHPLNIVFDEEGVCSGCRVHEEKYEIDWAEKAKKLTSIFNDYKNISGNNYDCIVPVSGAKDSYFIVHTVKNVYGMNPLLVTYNKQYNTDVGVRNLANLRTQFNCDILTLTVSPDTVKKITRATMRRMGSIYWHCIAGQTVFPVQIAVKFKIPLIVWGAHQGNDQVGMFSHHDEVEMTRKYRKEHDLMGYEAEDLVSDFDGITEKDIVQFKYPDNIEIERVGVRGIYLNNYMHWDSKLQHEQMINLYGYETALQTRTFDTYNDVDCYNYSDVHDYIKFIKHGYGKVVDHATREIRLKRLTREQGIQLINAYINKEPKNLEMFLEWLGITKNSFNYIINQHRNPKIWKKDADFQWQLIHPNHSLFIHPNVNRLEMDYAGENDFELTAVGKSTDRKNKYIIIGKGTDNWA
ncbi:MAG: N-acetyl sugar amidotransferase [Chitinophagaceae bacterium]|nr:N-acetyl sugar amidotransferase [Chitinophagaceae bacterium]MCW5904046.1 N-acetyl sugar amidotransferase [Chitinophagaceae bacterium]